MKDKSFLFCPIYNILLPYYCAIHLKYVYFNVILNIYINVFACFLNIFYNEKSNV